MIASPVKFVDIVAKVQEVVVEESVRYKDLTFRLLDLLLLKVSTNLTDRDGDVEKFTEEEAGCVLVELVVDVFAVVPQK